MENRRSKGIMILGWSEVIFGAALLLIAIICYASFPRLAQADAQLGYAISMGIYQSSFWGGIYIPIAGLLVLNLKPLGRWMNILGAGYIIFRGLRVVIIFSIIRHSFSSSKPAEVVIANGLFLVITALLPIVICAILLIFLTRPKVRVQFSHLDEERAK